MTTAGGAEPGTALREGARLPLILMGFAATGRRRAGKVSPRQKNSSTKRFVVLIFLFDKRIEEVAAR
jgi:hypothetical protein